jgi:hypothetical protein
VPSRSAIFAALADEAGLSLTPEAERTAPAILVQAEAGNACGNARLAVRPLNQVTTAQARRVATPPETQLPATLSTVIGADIPSTSTATICLPTKAGRASTCRPDA